MSFILLLCSGLGLCSGSRGHVCIRHVDQVLVRSRTGVPALLGRTWRLVEVLCVLVCSGCGVISGCLVWSWIQWWSNNPALPHIWRLGLICGSGQAGRSWCFTGSLLLWSCSALLWGGCVLAWFCWTCVRSNCSNLNINISSFNRKHAGSSGPTEDSDSSAALGLCWIYVSRCSKCFQLVRGLDLRQTRPEPWLCASCL